MEEHDSVKALSDKDMDGVMGGAYGLGGWGTKRSSVDCASVAEAADEFLDVIAQKGGKGTNPASY